MCAVCTHQDQSDFYRTNKSASLHKSSVNDPLIQPKIHRHHTVFRNYFFFILNENEREKIEKKNEKARGVIVSHRQATGCGKSAPSFR